jgi:hypothetical protein
MDRDDYWRYRAESDTQDLMRLAGFQPIDLHSTADNLLLIARHRDPIAKRLPLLRYASLSGWSKFTGEPLDAMWRRVAAELLLRAHEDLTASGYLPPLPDLDKEWHQPQHDRLTPRYPKAETLERALAEVGLSPHPRVILLVEGQTEQLHASRLLTELGLRDPQQDRRLRPQRPAPKATHSTHPLMPQLLTVLPKCCDLSSRRQSRSGNSNSRRGR